MTKWIFLGHHMVCFVESLWILMLLFAPLPCWLRFCEGIETMLVPRTLNAGFIQFWYFASFMRIFFIVRVFCCLFFLLLFSVWMAWCIFLKFMRGVSLRLQSIYSTWLFITYWCSLFFHPTCITLHLSTYKNIYHVCDHWTILPMSC